MMCAQLRCGCKLTGVVQYVNNRGGLDDGDCVCLLNCVLEQHFVIYHESCVVGRGISGPPEAKMDLTKVDLVRSGEE